MAKPRFRWWECDNHRNAPLSHAVGPDDADWNGTPDCPVCQEPMTKEPHRNYKKMREQS